MEKKRLKRKPFKRVLLPLFLTIGALSTFSLATVNTYAFDGYGGDYTDAINNQWYSGTAGMELYATCDFGTNPSVPNVDNWETYSVPLANSVFAQSENYKYQYTNSFCNFRQDVLYYNNYERQVYQIAVGRVGSTAGWNLDVWGIASNVVQPVLWDYFLTFWSGVRIVYSSTYAWTLSFQALDLTNNTWRDISFESQYSSLPDCFDKSVYPSSVINTSASGFDYGYIRNFRLTFTGSIPANTYFTMEIDTYRADTLNIQDYNTALSSIQLFKNDITVEGFGWLSFVNAFFSMEILPNFRMGYLIAMAVGVTTLGIIFKLAYGG